MNKTVNFLYQLLWFYIISPFFQKKTALNILFINRKRFEIQLRLATFLSGVFGTPIQVLIGDSNSEVFSNFRSANKFNIITVTMGIGGTRPDDWATFFSYKESSLILSLLQNSVRYIFWNIGGNSVLQGKMESAFITLSRLHEIFPNSFNFNIPPVHGSILKNLTGSKIDFKNDISTLNSWISQVWGTLAIDLHSILLNPATEESWYGTLADPVHYSTIAKNLITAFINGISGK